jgi:hypothetical protein
LFQRERNAYGLIELPWKSAKYECRFLGALMVHWNNLSANARKLLQKLVEASFCEEGSLSESENGNLVELMDYGLIEEGPDGWQVTPAGCSVYVVRDGLPYR